MSLDCIHCPIHFSAEAPAVCCDMNSNQIASLGTSLWPTAQDATVGPSKSFLDLSGHPIMYRKHLSLHTKTHVNSFHTHFTARFLNFPTSATVFIRVQGNNLLAYLVLGTNAASYSKLIRLFALKLNWWVMQQAKTVAKC